MSAPRRRALSDAVRHFWKTRGDQSRRQGSATGKRDQGGRSAVTGGKQLAGFTALVQSVIHSAGIPDAAIIARGAVLPGYFRPTKDWDLLVVHERQLVASLEFKSQIGPSFGNNFNNRAEEAIGSATDLWTAFREGAFKDSVRPWLGYFILLEDVVRSQSPVQVASPLFAVFPEFDGASYARRYELLCQRLVRKSNAAPTAILRRRHFAPEPRREIALDDGRSASRPALSARQVRFRSRQTVHRFRPV